MPKNQQNVLRSTGIARPLPFRIYTTSPWQLLQSQDIAVCKHWVYTKSWQHGRTFHNDLLSAHRVLWRLPVAAPSQRWCHKAASRQFNSRRTESHWVKSSGWLSPEMKTVTVSVIPVGISRDTVLQACGAGAEQDLGRWRGQAQGVQNTMQSWHLLGYPNSHPRTSSARQRYSTANLNYEPGLKGCTRIHHGKLHQDKPYEKTRFMEFIGPPLSRPIVISLESNHICLTWLTPHKLSLTHTFSKHTFLNVSWSYRKTAVSRVPFHRGLAPWLQLAVSSKTNYLSEQYVISLAPLVLNIIKT